MLPSEPPALPPLDLTDPQSVLNRLFYGLRNGNLDAIEPLVADESIVYAFYLEGGQSLSRETFLEHLGARIVTAPHCDGITRESHMLMVWLSDWSPPWQMTEICYMDCSEIDPPYESRAAAFMLGDQTGQWKIIGVYQNTPENYFFVDAAKIPLAPCNTPVEDIPDTALAMMGYTISDVCPGAPEQRLAADMRGKICTQRDRVALRAGPGRDYEVVEYFNPGTQFTVLQGAVCADGWSWWEIRTDDGYTGWMSEGGDAVDPYFLCPLP